MVVEKKQPFTLVELLVVIAIISVLAGMLLPALSKAMGSARLLTCASSEKQISLGWVSYTMDYRGFLLPIKAGPSTADFDSRGMESPDKVIWVWFMRGYIGLPDLPINLANPPFSALPVQDRQGILMCPASDRAPTSHTEIHFGMMQYNIGGGMAYGRKASSRIGQLKKPSKKFIFMDSAGYNENYSGSYFVGNSGASANFERHEGRANIAYGDGHVNSWAQDQWDAEKVTWYTSDYLGFD